MQTIHDLWLELLEHPTCSPDLAPFYNFLMIEAVEEAWFIEQAKIFFLEDIEPVQLRYLKRRIF